MDLVYYELTLLQRGITSWLGALHHIRAGCSAPEKAAHASTHGGAWVLSMPRHHGLTHDVRQGLTSAPPPPPTHPPHLRPALPCPGPLLPCNPRQPTTTAFPSTTMWVHPPNLICLTSHTPLLNHAHARARAPMPTGRGAQVWALRPRDRGEGGEGVWCGMSGLGGCTRAPVAAHTHTHTELGTHMHQYSNAIKPPSL